VSSFDVDFLTDGGQTAETVSAALVAFIAAAMRTLDVAIYDFHAREGASARIADALEAAAARGVGGPRGVQRRSPASPVGAPADGGEPR
jgi:phosphatidylserine/phosphatidylglycerophosphate/cardiolipin synthase-like enzyme